ncbi:MAG: phosphate propanoyltransferase [Clostridiales Family XIII bacterium]|jgi:putative phosphotransacetylase|nr:phosphate propanoyltransferase [Clostridiales Family XIII bacterium]
MPKNDALEQNIERRIREATIFAIYKQSGRRFVPAAISGRHVHLCRKDIDALFGFGYELTPMKPLVQPGQFASEETVTIVGPKGRIAKVRVLGPARPETQVEISVSDTFSIGIVPALRMSGDVAGTPGVRLETEKGSADLASGTIIAARHLHLSSSQAQALGLADGQIVTLRKNGPRAAILGSVVVRSGDAHEMEVHIDQDEANAALIRNGDLLEIV